MSGSEAKRMPEDTPPSGNGGSLRTRSREEELERALEERDLRLQALRRQLAEGEAFIARILGVSCCRRARCAHVCSVPF
jgi:hypothetical protein